MYDRCRLPSIVPIEGQMHIQSLWSSKVALDDLPELRIQEETFELNRRTRYSTAERGTFLLCIMLKFYYDSLQTLFWLL